MRTDKTVIFLHIPKTAGTTLMQIIRRFYQPDEMFKIETRHGAVADFKKLDLDTRARIRLLTGHQDFGLHAWIPRPYLYITVLREPIDCVMSHYYYAQRMPDHPNHVPILSRNLSLKDYLNSGLEVMISNSQTRMLSGRWSELGLAECPPEALTEAKANLQKYFSVVGLTERFDETLQLIKPVTGWDRLFYERKNETLNRPKVTDLSPDTLQAVQAANALDIELYRYATELFEQQIQSRGPAFTDELKEFQAGNRRYMEQLKINRSGKWRKFYYTVIKRYSLRMTLRKWFNKLR